VDGKHIVILCPSKSGSEFYNYKKVYSVILLAIVDANCKIIYTDVGTNSRVIDALVSSKSTFKLLAPELFFLILAHPVNKM